MTYQELAQIMPAKARELFIDLFLLEKAIKKFNEKNPALLTEDEERSCKLYMYLHDKILKENSGDLALVAQKILSFNIKLTNEMQKKVNENPDDTEARRSLEEYRKDQQFFINLFKEKFDGN